MQIGSYSFKKIIDSRGYTCSIEIIIKSIIESNTPKFHLSSSQIDIEKWRFALEFAGRLFIEKSYQNNSLNVDIVDFNWMPEDTTSSVVVYTMFKALENATGNNLNSIEFDENLKKFLLKL